MKRTGASLSNSHLLRHDQADAQLQLDNKKRTFRHIQLAVGGGSFAGGLLPNDLIQVTSGKAATVTFPHYRRMVTCHVSFSRESGESI